MRYFKMSGGGGSASGSALDCAALRSALATCVSTVLPGGVTPMRLMVIGSNNIPYWITAAQAGVIAPGSTISIYATDAAADADSGLQPGGYYQIDPHNDRHVYRKPIS